MVGMKEGRAGKKKGGERGREGKERDKISGLVELKYSKDLFVYIFVYRFLNARKQGLSFLCLKPYQGS